MNAQLYNNIYELNGENVRLIIDLANKREAKLEKKVSKLVAKLEKCKKKSKERKIELRLMRDDVDFVKLLKKEEDEEQVQEFGPTSAAVNVEEENLITKRKAIEKLPYPENLQFTTEQLQQYEDDQYAEGTNEEVDKNANEWLVINYWRKGETGKVVIYKNQEQEDLVVKRAEQILWDLGKGDYRPKTNVDILKYKMGLIRGIYLKETDIDNKKKLFNAVKILGEKIPEAIELDNEAEEQVSMGAEEQASKEAEPTSAEANVEEDLFTFLVSGEYDREAQERVVQAQAAQEREVQAQASQEKVVQAQSQVAPKDTYNVAYYKANRSKLLKDAKARYNANKTTLLACSNASYKANSHEILAQKKVRVDCENCHGNYATSSIAPHMLVCKKRPLILATEKEKKDEEELLLKSNNKVRCKLCNTIVGKISLVKHQKTKYCKNQQNHLCNANHY